MPTIGQSVDKLYRERFSDRERKMRDSLWKVLCQDFLQKYIPDKAVVLDMAAGYCNFINNIKAQTKYAVDINQETKYFANHDVSVIISSCTNLPDDLKGKIDVVFAGCLLEHLSSKDEIFKMFLEVKRILKPEGKFLILNPNIRLSTTDYWDYFDHLTAVSDRSVAEGLRLAGFKIEKVIPGFVPNTIKDHLPKSSFLVRIYLRLPFLFPLFGRQMFIVAIK